MRYFRHILLLSLLLMGTSLTFATETLRAGEYDFALMITTKKTTQAPTNKNQPLSKLSLNEKFHFETIYSQKNKLLNDPFDEIKIPPRSALYEFSFMNNKITFQILPFDQHFQDNNSQPTNQTLCTLFQINFY